MSEWAYFLDFDGTLVELVDRPDAARVDADVREILATLTDATGGAVALISGRTIADLEEHFGRSSVLMAGQHGAERISAQGQRLAPAIAPSALDAAREFLRRVLPTHKRLLLEDKGQSLALHYRLAPTMASFAHQAMRAAQHRAPDGFVVTTGKCVVELRMGDRDKGDAIADYRREMPFQHRRPVFIGDDHTDEAGFEMINQLDGLSVKVGPGASSAQWRLADVAAVRRWLGQVANQERPTVGARIPQSPMMHADA